MKATVRLVFLLVAGLSMAGCATTTAMKEPPPATVAYWSEQPRSARDYWMMRDIEDKLEAKFAANSR